MEALDARYPGFRDRLLDEKGELRQFVNVYLNDEDVRLGSGLKAKVTEKDEISIVPAVAGGVRRPHPVGARYARARTDRPPSSGGRIDSTDGEAAAQAHLRARHGQGARHLPDGQAVRDRHQHPAC
ncbi:MAG TPA: MoaD/ThiS family protein [Candidatus Dormibacteraeota bacterium]